MSNPFELLANSAFKNLHKQMIEGLLADTSCTVPCKLIYGATAFEECSNCLFDPIGGKSSNRFKSGGPSPFYHGVCPVCNGAGKIQDIATEILYLMPIWDSKDWYNLSQDKIKMAEINVQTMSKFETYPKLTKATSINIDTDITKYGVSTFTRVGRPEPCGLGDSSFIITSWKRQ